MIDFLRNGTPQSIVERYESLKHIADNTDFGELDNNIVVVDTEATGLSFTKDELIQIAAAKIMEGKIVDWYVTFVDPGQEISEEIEHLTHISNDDVAGAPTPTEALTGLVEFSGNAVMMAHNASFDKTFLTKHAAGYPLLENIWVDTLELSRIAFPRLTSHRLIDLAKALGIQESTHRADDDVATTCILYRLILACITEMPIELVKTISELADTDMWPTSYVFKFAYKFMSEYLDEGETNSFSMIKKMRNERVRELPTQNKNDVDLEDIVMSGVDEDHPVVSTDNLQFPDENAILNEYSKDGLLGKIYPDFEERDEQKQMAHHILEAYKESKNLVIEAGTGVGKSMAYLIPSIKLAKDNEIIVGVSTKTNALLDQLIYHELPALKKQIPDLVYSSLKGAKHYICLRKTAYLAESQAKLIDFKGEQFCNAASIASLLSYIEQTSYDDCDGIKVNGRALFKKQYTCASHECLRAKCPFYRNGCFVHGARRMAHNSDIVVTNHTMMFCDIKADGGLLPPIRYWIVDEAHGTESEARSAFSYVIGASELLDLSKALKSESVKKNLFLKATKNIDIDSLVAKGDAGLSNAEEVEGKNVIFGLLKKCITRGKEASDVIKNFAEHFNLLCSFAPKSKNGYEFSDIWIEQSIRESEEFNELYGYAKEFTTVSEALLSQVQNLVAYLDNYENTAIVSREISAFIFELKELLNACDLFFFNSKEAYVYHANLNTHNTIVQDQLICELIYVGDALNEGFYSQSKSIIMTSATLAIGDSFEAFENAVGLSPTETTDIQLSSSFDYDNNMTIYVANDMPDPRSDLYLDTLSNFLSKLHIKNNGSLLTLFTNRREMEKSHETVKDAVDPLRVICQKWGVSAKSCRDEFIADETVSLFALKSFWEGFDAPGSTLKGVVIPKLPFALPNDPLYKERCARENNAWTKYVLTESIIDVKQAVGRLIRKSSDKGFIVFADSRMISKFYGKMFLASMPSKNIKIMTIDEIINDL
ncbi:MAG: exonuclease domain-containing protein [Coriobacteriia bacterium]|nr:exonuclease domain-containing protein [Coriobacteriia bacterium]